eukprot:GHVN01088375.1.p1 GENE.GHVN01088375.1~~GHVN01088375.1.p1  ORF type:complete len:825 (-),score=60.05 GHVN01088375.1:581-3055(-)
MTEPMSNKQKRRNQKRKRKQSRRSSFSVSPETDLVVRSAAAPASASNDSGETESPELDLRFNLTVRNETVNENDRSVEVVLATESRVMVYDRRNNRVIEEILLMSGMINVDHAPLLNDHRTFDLDQEFGSVQNFRVSGSKLNCRFYFADLSELAAQGDEEARRIERAWLKVKQGHHKAVSVGYRVFAGTVIEPGESQKVNGKIYKAGELPLRIATRWKPREGSLTVFQADDAAHIRTETKNSMNDKLLAHLQTQGLRSDATAGEAWDFLAKLSGQQRSIAEAMIESTDSVPENFVRTESATNVDDPNVASGTPPSDVTDTGERSQPTTPVVDSSQQADTITRSEAAALVAETLTAERTRTAGIRSAYTDSGVQNEALLQRGLNDSSWTPARMALELMPFVRGSRSEPVRQDLLEGQAPGGHSVRQADTNAITLALMLRESSVPLDHAVFNSPQAVRALPQTLRASVNDANRAQAMEIAHRYETYSMVDLCRTALAIEGRQIPHNRDEMVRAAMSSGSLQAIFSTNVSLRVLASYVDTEDTTVMWTTEADVDNFQTNERATMGKVGKLTKHSRGGKADHMNTDAGKEEYKLARYSGQMVTDEMDIIDDRMGSLDSETPEDMGMAARQLRPDLCYAELLANGNLDATGAALFTSGQNNLFTGAGSALSIPAIGAGRTAMKTQRIKERTLNLALKYLLVPAELEDSLDQMLNSRQIRESEASNGTNNFLFGKGLVGIAEDRLGPNGVVHPDTGVSYTGTSTNYFGTAQPGVNGAKTMEVGFRRGTGRAPQINPFVKNDGCWVIGQAIKMDIGVKPLDYRGFQKHVGA